MERVIQVAVDAVGGVLPKTPQYAGVQGEHNACRVTFDVTAWAEEPFLYRGEFVGGDGAGGTTAVLEVEEGHVSFLLPAAWTAAGGRAVARLVASVTVDGEETQTVYAVDVPLYFAAKQEYDGATREEAYTGLTALAEAVQTAVDTVEEKLADGSFVGPRGPEGKQGVSGVYVGSGEMPEGYNVQVDPDGKVSLIRIGAVETLGEGERATASIIEGEEGTYVLNLGIPLGRTGPKGGQGDTPYIGTNLNWWINGVDTGFPSRGDTPYIGANLNWWVGGVDTKVVAAGQHGQDGQTPYIQDGFWYIGSTKLCRAEGYSPYIGTDGNWVIMGNYNSGVPATGPQGNDGLTPYIGDNGNWRIGGEDTGVSALGVSPHIGENGNWWIDEFDSGVAATGPKGEDAVLNEFELIASGETTESVNGVTVTLDNDGNPFELRDMVTIYIYTPVAAQDSPLSIAINGDDNSPVHQIANAVLTSTAKYSRALLLYSGLKWDCYAYTAVSPAANTAPQTRDRYGKKDDRTISAIQLYLHSNESYVLPVGFKYEIYGRRV